jgi:hypothetical protein
MGANQIILKSSEAMTSYRLFLDGTIWCATGPGFTNLQKSPAGFGRTEEDTRVALILDIGKYARRRGDPAAEGRSRNSRLADRLCAT